MLWDWRHIHSENELWCSHRNVLRIVFYNRLQPMRIKDQRSRLNNHNSTQLVHSPHVPHSWSTPYLFYATQLVHGSLVAVHAVFSQVQVSRVLQFREYTHTRTHAVSTNNTVCTTCAYTCANIYCLWKYIHYILRGKKCIWMVYQLNKTNRAECNIYFC